jgi:hypothetical protein
MQGQRTGNKGIVAVKVGARARGVVDVSKHGVPQSLREVSTHADTVAAATAAATASTATTAAATAAATAVAAGGWGRCWARCVCRALHVSCKVWAGKRQEFDGASAARSTEEADV